MQGLEKNLILPWPDVEIYGLIWVIKMKHLLKWVRSLSLSNQICEGFQCCHLARDILKGCLSPNRQDSLHPSRGHERKMYAARRVLNVQCSYTSFLGICDCASHHPPT